MKINRLTLGALALCLFGSANAFASSGPPGDNLTAGQCLATSGSGSSFTYHFKNPGWDGKACRGTVKIWACKGNTCQKTSKGSDAYGEVKQGQNFRPGFHPKSRAVDS